jgi:UDP-sugar transporter A1/2/3
MVPLLSSRGQATAVASLHNNHVLFHSLRQSALLSAAETSYNNEAPQASSVSSCLKDSLSIAVGPAVLLGGTFFVYSAAATSRGTRSALSPMAATCMLLLALQYSIQPRLSKRYIPPTSDKKTVALVEEIMKTLTALMILVTTHSKSALAQMKQDWSFSSSVMVAGIPASLYAIQGVLTYSSYQSLDPVTFNGLQQTKIISAAIFCFLLLGARQSKVQVVSLLMLTLSAMLFQGRNDVNMMSTTCRILYNQLLGKENDDIDGRMKKNDDLIIASKQQQQKQTMKQHKSVGIITCLLATAISGLAGSLSQKGLQMTGIGGRNAYLFTVEVSLYSAICLLLSCSSRRRSKSLRLEEFRKWNAGTVLAILCKALGGLLTALVHKYAGSVTKGFCLILGLVLTGAIQAVLDRKTLSTNQMVGTALVLLSSYLHFTNPVV